MENREEILGAVEGALERRIPRSLNVATRGIKTGGDFAEMMSALMSDLIDGRVEPGVANAACNAGGKLLRVVELQMKFGTTPEGGSEKVLRLARPDTP